MHTFSEAKTKAATPSTDDPIAAIMNAMDPTTIPAIIVPLGLE
jgi:hypothetical protein